MLFIFDGAAISFITPAQHRPWTVDWLEWYHIFGSNNATKKGDDIDSQQILHCTGIKAYINEMYLTYFHGNMFQ